MDKIKLKDFTIVPILDSLSRVDITDEEYFSKRYRNYVSNSRLKNINKEEGGSPELYKNPPRFTTQSLQVGSAVHERVLQPNDFVLAPKLGRPTAKLGNCIDEIIKERKKGNSIYQSILNASHTADYYDGRLDSTKIKNIIKKGLPYYLASKSLKGNEIVLSDTDHTTVTSCIESIESNSDIMNTLHPTTIFGDPIDSFNEDAFFIDFAVLYKEHYKILKFKMKIDNWTIDQENKILTLNDLKTSSKPAAWFMNTEYGSMFHYRYFRQFGAYGEILKLYCMKEYGFNSSWAFNSNVLVVHTGTPYESIMYPISKNLLTKGKREFYKLLKEVAYYEIFGYENEVKFE